MPPTHQSRNKIDRQLRVAELRLRGYGDQYRIAAMLGVAQPTICRDMKELDARFRAAALQDIITAIGIDLERIEKIITVVFPLAMAGDLIAVKRIEGLLAARAKLLGLNAPIRAEAVVRHVAARPDLSALSDDDLEFLSALSEKVAIGEVSG